MDKVFPRRNIYPTKLTLLDEDDPLWSDAWPVFFSTVMTMAPTAAKRIPRDLAQPRKVRKSGNGSMRTMIASNAVHTGIAGWKMDAMFALV